jgi:hypothetical protein
MTRAEAEHRIAEHMESIIAILREYNPESKYLSLFYHKQNGQGYYHVNNEYYDADAEHPIDFGKNIIEPWKDLLISKDPVTETYEIKVDGEPRYEHLAEDEFTEVMHQLLAERKE